MNQQLVLSYHYKNDNDCFVRDENDYQVMYHYALEQWEIIENLMETEKDVETHCHIMNLQWAKIESCFVRFWSVRLEVVRRVVTHREEYASFFLFFI